MCVYQRFLFFIWKKKRNGKKKQQQQPPMVKNMPQWGRLTSCQRIYLDKSILEVT